MKTDFDFADFRSGVKATAETILGRVPAWEDLVQSARAVQEMAEVCLARNQADEDRIACGPECGDCCVVNVAILAPEAAVIVDFLENRCSASELHALHQKTASQFTATGYLDDDERILLRRPCIFLDPGKSCSIYPVRPLLCRGVTSTDPVACREAISRQAFDESVPILVNLFQARLFESAFTSLAGALQTAGLDARSRELTQAVKTLLDTRLQPQPKPQPS